MLTHNYLCKSVSLAHKNSQLFFILGATQLSSKTLASPAAKHRQRHNRKANEGTCGRVKVPDLRA